MLIGWSVIKMDLLINTQKRDEVRYRRKSKLQSLSFLFYNYFVVFYLIGINKINILDGC
jgi:hypothetical protein